MPSFKRSLFVFYVVPLVFSWIPMAFSQNVPLPPPDRHYPPEMFKNPSDCDGVQTVIRPEYDPDEILTIRVVFHNIHRLNGEGLLDEATINAQIQEMNDNFATIIGPDGPIPGGSGIRFELATEAPDGSPTNGINYVVNDDWFTGLAEDFGPSLMWDSSRYVNIFTYQSDPTGFSGYIRYWAWEPDKIAEVDGIFLGYEQTTDVSHVVGPTSTGATLAGWYFGLFGTWSSNCPNGDCYKTGDLICDTNPHRRTTNRPCQDLQSCGVPEPYNNFSSFTSSTCRTHFTPEQVNRMRCSIYTYRPGILKNTEPPEPLAKRWLPHLTAVNGGFQTNIFLTNTSDQSQEVTLNGYDPQGAFIEANSFTLDAGERRVLSQDEAFPLTHPSHAGIKGSEMIVATAAYQVANQPGVSAHLAELQSTEQAFLIHLGESEYVFDGIAYLNLGEGPAQVTAEVLESDGTLGESIMLSETLPSGAKGLAVLSNLFPTLSRGMIKISADQPITIVGLRGSNAGEALPFLFYNPVIPLP